MAQTVRRVIPDGDYPARLSEAYAAAVAAAEDERKNGTPPLYANEDPPSVVLAAEHQALKAEAEEDAEGKNRVVVLRAIGRSAWRRLKGAHPVRIKGADGVTDEAAEEDRLGGVNTESVVDDLVHACLAAPSALACSEDQRMPLVQCTPENPCSNRAAYDKWAEDDMAPGEFAMLVRDAWGLINSAFVDPKSLPPSPTRSNGGN